MTQTGSTDSQMRVAAGVAAGGLLVGLALGWATQHLLRRLRWYGASPSQVCAAHSMHNMCIVHSVQSMHGTQRLLLPHLS